MADADTNTMRRLPAVPLLLAATSVVLILAYLAAPATRDAEVIAAASPFLAAATVAITALAARATRPTGWPMVACGLALFGVARLVGAWEWFGDTGPVFPGAYHATVLLAYPALVLGIAGARPTSTRLRPALDGVEPAIYALVATVLVWLAFTGPYFDGDDLPYPRWVWVVANPVLIAGFAWQLWVRGTRRGDDRRSVANTAIGVLLFAAGELTNNLAWAYDGFHPGDLTSIVWMAGPLAVAVVATMPRTVAEMRDGERRRPASWSHLVALLVTSVGALGVLVFAATMGVDSGRSRAVVCTAALLVVALAVIEGARLAVEVREYVDFRGAERLAAMVEHSSDVVLLSDADGIVSYVSPGVQMMLGREPDTVAGRHVLELFTNTERAALQSEFDRLVALGNSATLDFESDMVHADGQLRKATVVIANLLGSDAVNGIITTVRDVTEQRNLERQLSHRAFHDELTGLANRALFLDRMDHALRVTRSEADPVVVLFVDLDDFKRVNDSLGHGSGDQVLQVVGGRLRRAAGTGDTAARLGGDEFAILLEDRGGIDRAINVAEGLLADLSDPVEIGGHTVSVLASIGVAVAAPGISTASLLRDADVAMYEAKRAGKGQIRIFDPAMRLVASKHLAYRGALGAALDNEELRLVYMPYVDLRTGQVTGAEALVRWAHPEFGEISAAEFVPIAERSGLIVPMGYWIIENGLRHAARWRPESRLYLSFNVSQIQLMQPEFVDTLIGMVEASGVDPELVVLEVTEAVLSEESGRVRDTFTRLSEYGFRFAVDDFGSGSASIAYVQRYPVSLIKIASAAVAEFGDNPSEATLTRMILQMAESLGVITVAEGIESTRQLHELRRLGCDLGQGYLLSHPLEADELERRFVERSPTRR